MPRFSTYVGLDAHKKSIVLAYTGAGLDHEPQHLGSISSDYTRLKAKLLKLGVPKEIEICYEAGPTGYGLLPER